MQEPATRRLCPKVKAANPETEPIIEVWFRIRHRDLLQGGNHDSGSDTIYTLRMSTSNKPATTQKQTRPSDSGTTALLTINGRFDHF